MSKYEYDFDRYIVGVASAWHGMTEDDGGPTATAKVTQFSTANAIGGDFLFEIRQRQGKPSQAKPSQFSAK